jgi:hypothetical protein
MPQNLSLKRVRVTDPSALTDYLLGESASFTLVSAKSGAAFRFFTRWRPHGRCWYVAVEGARNRPGKAKPGAVQIGVILKGGNDLTRPTAFVANLQPGPVDERVGTVAGDAARVFAWFAGHLLDDRNIPEGVEVFVPAERPKNQTPDSRQ